MRFVIIIVVVLHFLVPAVAESTKVLLYKNTIEAEAGDQAVAHENIDQVTIDELEIQVLADYEIMMLAEIPESLSAEFQATARLLGVA